MLSDPEDGPLEPGAKLDSYELLGIVARGGMANVWLARQRMKHDLEILVALKTVLPELSLDPAFQAMFLDEARIACRIDHANVARLLQVGEARGHTFIVMEYVAGESLSRLRRTLVRDGEAMPLEVVLRVASDLCSALHAVHELVDADGQLLNVVHRDVSPQNILLSDGGVVKLIDFGVAKARDRFAAETSAGFAKGKPRYMAPEQSRGSHIDRRADVWAVGAVLYELVSGRTPFDGPSDAAVFRQLMGDAPIDPLPAEVPAPVRSVVSRALQRDPEARFPSALAMRDAIEDAASALGLHGTNVSVERLCTRKLGKRIAERKREVDGWIRTANARVGLGSLSLAAMTSAKSSPRVLEESSATSAPSPPQSAPTRRRGRATLLAIVGLAAMIAVAGAARVVIGRTPSPGEAIAPMRADPARLSVPAPAPAPSASSSAVAPSAVASSVPAAAAPPAPAPAVPAAADSSHPPPHARARTPAAQPHDWGGIQ